MVKQTARISWFLGYTLVELMVVISIIGAIAAMTLYGLKASNSAESVDIAQKAFISNLHSIQTRVDSGEVTASGGVVQEFSLTNGTTYYKINGQQINTNGPVITVTTSGPSILPPFTICVADRNLTMYDSTKVAGVAVHQCSGCTSGSGYVCGGGTTAVSPTSVVVTFTSGSVFKKVTIKGFGMRITEIDSS